MPKRKTATQRLQEMLEFYDIRVVTGEEAKALYRDGTEVLKPDNIICVSKLREKYHNHPEWAGTFVTIMQQVPNLLTFVNNLYEWHKDDIINLKELKFPDHD